MSSFKKEGKKVLETIFSYIASAKFDCHFLRTQFPNLHSDTSRFGVLISHAKVEKLDEIKE